MRPEPWHLLILLIVIIVIFGAKRLPDITRNVGKSMRIFKSEVKSLRDDDDDEDASAKRTSDSSATSTPQPLEGRAVDRAREEQRSRDEQHRPSA
ncbi:Sec-independent protein translocase subunit TatA [uncultured Pseudokineococcus sp.]|uniref:Sec-independent protein translocase subunit TatA n=1 Tax=uncultured Pseudokineococcus sp. TaxID=1642928 RepID=UPI002639CA67|nr:Sec-independent protein translocase subunit TatA [uncultured Pseudokineococcus sp.]